MRHNQRNPEVSEATKARIRAERELARRKADTPRVRALLNEWQRIRDRNSIAASFEADMRGRST